METSTDTMPRYPRTGGPIVKRVPDGDNVPRLVCDTCGYISYDNPKIVVGAVATWEKKFLLCRRAIEPQKGFWTLPAGFLELKETPEQGARREAKEEANAEIEIDLLLGIYTIPRISLVQLIYRAILKNTEISPGPESLEVGLFQPGDVPWGELAFPSATWALRHHSEALGRSIFPPFTNPEDDDGNYQPSLAGSL